MVLAAIAVVLADSLSKWMATASFAGDDPRGPVRVGRWLTLDLSTNTGVAFGLLRNQTVLSTALVTVGLIVVAIVGWRATTSDAMPLACAFGLVLGGALGNAIDRAGDGTVTDFIEIGRWPSFNVADASITIGAVLILGYLWRHG